MITTVRQKSSGDIYTIKNLDEDGGYLSKCSINNPNYQKEGFRTGLDRRAYLDEYYEIISNIQPETKKLLLL